MNDKQREQARLRATKHGRAGTPEHRVWCAMKTRCRPGGPEHKNYAGRGISICLRWAESFAAFFEDMGPRPSDKHTIERIDNAGNYEPANCRWATRYEQNRNKRNTPPITLNGETLHLHDWAARTGLPYPTIVSRLNRGWSVERALTEPARAVNQAFRSC